jgi:hypothetical protein
VTEDLGARIEESLDKRLLKQSGYQRHYEEWFDYLRIAFDKEPVGHRYLRTLVLRLKVELGMMVASLPFAAGALCVNAAAKWRIGVCCLGAVAFAYFWLEARASNKALSQLRRELLKKEWNPAPQVP